MPESDTVAVLRDPATIRARAQEILDLGRAGRLTHFAIDDAKIGEAVERVVAITRATYPDLRVPIHGRYRHFEAGGVDRLAPLRARMSALSSVDRASRLWELTVISVLLDAGAGPAWSYREEETGQTIGRSEGLAVATLRAFARGDLSDHHRDPLHVGTTFLRECTPASLAHLFQVSEGNPLVGLEGRASLLRRLGDSVAAASKPGEHGKLGSTLVAIVDTLGRRVTAARLFARVLADTQEIWPVRRKLEGVSLGDVWPHPALGERLMPFHKLTQWLTYSLVEPLGEAGVEVVDLDALTGLPEYRNGGLLLDVGAIVPKSATFLGHRHDVGSEAIVELRALTVAMLDEIAAGVRKALGKTSIELPLAAVLQGGTWTAGRAIAAERRAGGGPPFDVESDGTVF